MVGNYDHGMSFQPTSMEVLMANLVDCNLPDKVIVSLQYLQTSSMLNVPYSGKEKHNTFVLSRHVRL